MGLKKSEGYNSFWACRHKLRGGIEVSQYEDRILLPQFVEHVPDNHACQKVVPVGRQEGSSFWGIGPLRGDKVPSPMT
jgi:hypothetical protein